MAFRWSSTSHVLTVAVGGVKPGNLALARAHWVTRDIIAWNVGPVDSNTAFRLHADPAGGLALSDDGVSGGIAFDLTLDPAGLPADVRARFPHLAGFAALKLPPEAAALASNLLRGELAVSKVSKAKGGVRQDATSLQIPGVLDELYFYGGRLGATFAGGVPSLGAHRALGEGPPLRRARGRSGGDGGGDDARGRHGDVGRDRHPRLARQVQPLRVARRPRAPRRALRGDRGGRALAPRPGRGVSPGAA
ncbi:MAG TPA: hypothetical protein VIW03_12505 [Anaeromyxobacter sp.]